MEKVIITVSREYGSGGRLIGEIAAKKLDIPFYNHNLIDMVAHETGLAAGYIDHWEEQVSSPRLWGIPMPRGAGAGAAAVLSMNYYSNEDRMYAAQSRIIREIAAKGSCVIVGRCADYILKDNSSVLRVFIHADKEIRLRRIREEYGETDEKGAEGKIRLIDRGRAAYYKKHADGIWGDCHNYHLTLDSGLLGPSMCAELIVQAALDMQGNRK